MNKKSFDRSLCVLVYEVAGANPNGDPDNNNMPRTLPDGRGLVSPVCTKRKIRDLFADHDSNFFKEFSEKIGFEPENFNILESKSRGYSGLSESDSAAKAIKLAKSDPDAFCKRYADVRWFGTTMLPSGFDSDINGEKGRFLRTGCVTVGLGTSVSPIETIELSITKHSPFTKDKDGSMKCGDFGDIKAVRHGLYVQILGINPYFAEKTGTTSDDIDTLKKSIKYMLSNSTAAARPVGTINLVHAWWINHSSSIGSFNEGSVINTLTPTRKGNLDVSSNNIQDYDIPTDSSLSKEQKKGVASIEDLA